MDGFPFQKRFRSKLETNTKSIYLGLELDWVGLNNDFLILISLQPNVNDLRYFKLCIWLDQIV